MSITFNCNFWFNYLTLRTNDITSLPGPDMPKMKGLKVLDLADNMLDALPESEYSLIVIASKSNCIFNSSSKFTDLSPLFTNEFSLFFQFIYLFHKIELINKYVNNFGSSFRFVSL